MTVLYTLLECYSSYFLSLTLKTRKQNGTGLTKPKCCGTNSKHSSEPIAIPYIQNSISSHFPSQRKMAEARISSTGLFWLHPYYVSFQDRWIHPNENPMILKFASICSLLLMVILVHPGKLNFVACRAPVIHYRERKTKQSKKRAMVNCWKVNIPFWATLFMEALHHENNIKISNTFFFTFIYWLYVQSEKLKMLGFRGSCRRLNSVWNSKADRPM